MTPPKRPESPAYVALLDDFTAALRRAEALGWHADISIRLKLSRRTDGHSLGEIRRNFGRTVQFLAEPFGRAIWSSQTGGIRSERSFVARPVISLLAGVAAVARRAAKDYSARHDLFFIEGAPFHVRARLPGDILILSPPPQAHERDRHLILFANGAAQNWLTRTPFGWRLRPSGERPAVDSDEDASIFLVRTWLGTTSGALSAHASAALEKDLQGLRHDGLAPIIPVRSFRRSRRS